MKVCAGLGAFGLGIFGVRETSRELGRGRYMLGAAEKRGDSCRCSLWMVRVHGVFQAAVI